MPANGRYPYNDPRWPRIRPVVLARDDHSCTSCGRGTDDGVILDVDHIIEVRKRPDLAFEPTNLRTLCRPCHGRKTHGRRRSRVW